MAMHDDRLPVSVLTGFLGSGKTTLLNRLLSHPRMGETAVIVNEFGEIGIDEALVVGASDQVLLMESGCLCCTLRGNLVDTLGDLMNKRRQGDVPAFSRIVIETTGLADPAPILQALMTDLMLIRHCRMGMVVAVVDALHGGRTLDEQPEAVQQAAMADCLLISKTDIAALADEESLRRRLKRLNPAAPQLAVQFGQIDPDTLFGPLQPDPVRGAAAIRDWLDAAGHPVQQESGVSREHATTRHDARIRSYVFSSETPMEWHSVAGWLDELVRDHGENILRIKGLLNITGQEEPVLIQGVRDRFHPPAALTAWPDEDHRSRLVFIVRDLDPGELLPGSPF